MKTMDAIRRAAERQGWKIRVRRNGHTAWVAPTGKTIWASKSPSCDGAPYAHLKMMRREGFVWPSK